MTHTNSDPATPQAQTRQEYWREKVSQFKSSGLSQSEFCRQQGLKLSSLNYWYHALNRVKSKPVKQSNPSFIKIRSDTPVSHHQMTLVLPNGLRLTWQGACDVKYISTLVKEVS